MIRSTPLRFLGVLLGAAIVSSCTDGTFGSPTAPADAVASHAVHSAIKGPDVNVALSTPSRLELSALWWEKKAKSAVQVSKTIDASGGVISMPATGLTIVFPQGAVNAPIQITVTADDKYVAYKMEPSGTKFLKDVTVTQLLGVTKLPDSPLRSQLFAAYIADDGLKLSGKIPVLEIEPSSTVFSPRTGLPEAQVWVIRHFSRYMLASG
ncbi:MAG: hypothetical protein ABI408_09370 [Gemmatimonadaceae bacterium]